MKSVCPVTGCSRSIPTSLFMCGKCWKKLPNTLKRKVRGAWKDGHPNPWFQHTLDTAIAHVGWMRVVDAERVANG